MKEVHINPRFVKATSDVVIIKNSHSVGSIQSFSPASCHPEDHHVQRILPSLYLCHPSVEVRLLTRCLEWKGAIQNARLQMLTIAHELDDDVTGL